MTNSSVSMMTPMTSCLMIQIKNEPKLYVDRRRGTEYSLRRSLRINRRETPLQLDTSVLQLKWHQSGTTTKDINHQRRIALGSKCVDVEKECCRLHTPAASNVLHTVTFTVKQP
uniref:(northern house mosquito) hypothetical protein n=1 Tax=Culex pipiens TaxID=7175 RepID=A0A8D7ZU65_CULPI